MFDKSFVTPVRANFYQTSIRVAAVLDSTIQVAVLDSNTALAHKKIFHDRAGTNFTNKIHGDKERPLY